MTQRDLLSYVAPRVGAGMRLAPESIAAGEDVDAAGQRARIVVYLRGCSVPQTDDQIRQATGTHPNSVRWRLAELRLAGAVDVADKLGVSEAGKGCRRWEAVR